MSVGIQWFIYIYINLGLSGPYFVKPFLVDVRSESIVFAYGVACFGHALLSYF